MSEAVDLYNNIYGDFGSRVEAAVRHHAFGEDMGQSSWITAEWHAARRQHRDELVAREGDTNFAGLQRFLACVHQLSAERRLSRYCYLAEKAA